MAARALLFDLDGTLVDSVPDIAAATNVLLGKHNLQEYHEDEVRTFIGNGVRKLVERAFAGRDSSLGSDLLDERTDEMMVIYAQNLTAKTQAMRGAVEALKTAKSCGYAIAVVTNKPEGFSREIVNHFGWETLVDVIIGGDTCKTCKPEPEMLFRACEMLSISPELAVMVGDSPADIHAAQNAKIQSIAVRGGYTNIPVEQLGADIVIDTLEELTSALKQLPALGV